MYTYTLVHSRVYTRAHIRVIVYNYIYMYIYIADNLPRYPQRFEYGNGGNREQLTLLKPE